MLFTVLIGLLSIYFSGCKHNNEALFEVDKIGMQCDTNQEEGSVLFKIKIINNDAKPISLDDSSEGGNLQPAAFLLVSNRLYTGAVQLSLGAGYKESVVNGKTSKDIWVSVYHVTLRHELRTQSPTNATYSEVKNFLESGKYSIIYSSFRDSTFYFVNKPVKIQCSCKM